MLIPSRPIRARNANVGHETCIASPEMWPVATETSIDNTSTSLHQELGVMQFDLQPAELTNHKWQAAWHVLLCISLSFLILFHRSQTDQAKMLGFQASLFGSASQQMRREKIRITWELKLSLKSLSVKPWRPWGAAFTPDIFEFLCWMLREKEVTMLAELQLLLPRLTRQLPWKSRAAEECRTGQPHCYRRSPLIEACPTIPPLQNSTHQFFSMAKALQVSDPHGGNWTCAGSSIFIDLSCNMEAQANVQRTVCNSAVM